MVIHCTALKRAWPGRGPRDHNHATRRRRPDSHLLALLHVRFLATCHHALMAPSSSPPNPVLAQLQRENERLRAEVARMSRLLDLRAGETEPSEQQLAAPLRRDGLVTLASPVEQKLRLYADLFRGRTDVHAVRWQNTRTGAAGWMPAVAGGWRKGMDRRTAPHLPLTAAVLSQHLRSDERTFVGLYPLLEDNSCWFLVADLDGSTALVDALAVVKAARANGVPAGLELSQSGRGAHVWIFFTEAVPAATARSMGTLLLHEAIGMRGTMDLRSYDRLFPNQEDRKSTRLNSSHVAISYAVFCLKKKKIIENARRKLYQEQPRRPPRTGRIIAFRDRGAWYAGLSPCGCWTPSSGSSD